MEWFYDEIRRTQQMEENVKPENKSDIQVSLVNKNVESMRYYNNKDWVGHGNFPSYLKPDGEPIIFPGKQPLKTGIIYQGINKHKLPCAWLLAFSALGGGTTLKAYVSAGKLEKFNNVKWDDVSFKLEEGDASIEHVDPATGCHAKAKIEIFSSTQGGQVVHLSAVFDSDRAVRSMFLLEETRLAHAYSIDSSPNSSSPHALYSHSHNSSSNSNNNRQNNFNQGSNNHYHNKNNKRKGNQNNKTSTSNQGGNTTSSPPPHSPHPITPWLYPYAPSSYYGCPQQDILGSRLATTPLQRAYAAHVVAHPSSYWPPYAPIVALAYNFNGLTVQPPPDNWYMDSGASNQFASNPGSQYQMPDSQVQ